MVALSSSIALGAEPSNYFKDTYITAGFGKSFSQSKVNVYALKDGNENYYEKKKLKNANLYKLAIGKDFGQFRSEIEFIYSGKHKLNNAVDYVAGDTYSYHLHTTHKALFLNGYYDFKKLHSSVTPYVGAGIGISHNTVSKETLNLNGVHNGTWSKKSKNSFAYNLTAGILFKLNKNVHLDFSYKFIDFGKLKGSTALTPTSDPEVATTPANVKGRVKSNVFLVGIGIKF